MCLLQRLERHDKQITYVTLDFYSVLNSVNNIDREAELHT